MCVFEDVMLVPLLAAEYDEVAITQRSDQEILLFSRQPHIMKWIMRFIRVAAALQITIPYLERLVI